MADMAKMEDWLGAIPSPQTRKNYRNGIRRALDFDKVISNLRQSSYDFNSERKLVERICDLAGGFKETANEMTHSLYHIARKNEIDEKGIQEILDLISELEKNIT